MISNTLYNLVIYPFEFVIEIVYFLFGSTPLGSKLIIVGVLINILAIPLYNVADVWQKKESDLQKKFKLKIDEIKAVFSGDKRQMIIQTYYRINNYHPIYSLRSLIGLLIQVPIFIAAYHFISNLPGLDGRTFGIIKDLSKPDGLIKIGSIAINLLPILMTIFNILASLLHTKDLTDKERKPLFVMAALFLVLLYNSPSALLVYWTTTNIFSLIKNILILFKDNIKKIMKPLIIFYMSTIFIFFVLINTKILYVKPDAAIIINSLFLFSILVLIIQIFPYQKIVVLNKKDEFTLFVSAGILLFMLLGVFIPASLISSSPEEFENVGNLIVQTSSKMLSMLFIYPVIFYCIFGDKVKKQLLLIICFSSMYALFNTFFFKGDYGNLSPDFLFDFSDALSPSISNNILNILSGFVLLTLIIFFIKIKKTTIIKNIMAISFLALMIMSIKDLHAINQTQKNITYRDNSKKVHSYKKYKEKIIDLSKNGNNVFVIFMDRAIAYYLPIIFENIPEIEKNLEGFVWYKNTLSLSTGTLAGIFPILGGYDYTPLEIMKRDKESLRNKYNEATLLLPQTFLSNGYTTTLVYPPLAGWNWGADVSIFKPYSNIKAYEKAFNIDSYINDYVELNNDHIDIYLMRFSLFRSLPMIARKSVYNDGNWTSPYERTSLNHGFKEYQYVHELTNIINIVSNTNTYTFFGNEMTHEPFYFNSDYKPSIDMRKADKDDLKIYRNDFMAKQLYVNTAMLIELTNFIQYLKNNNIYDNTKIILVSDHGGYIPVKSIFGFEKNIFSRSIDELNCFNSLLMVKDFSNKKPFSISTNFITTADVALLATEHMTYPVNSSNKRESKELGIYGVIIASRLSEQNKNTFNLQAMFHMKPDIFNKINWQEITNYKDFIKNE